LASLTIFRYLQRIFAYLVEVLKTSKLIEIYCVGFYAIFQICFLFVRNYWFRILF